MSLDTPPILRHFLHFDISVSVISAPTSSSPTCSKSTYYVQRRLRVRTTPTCMYMLMMNRLWLHNTRKCTVAILVSLAVSERWPIQY
ncbi:hypothetical protein GDO81_012469 [Engystomops pustulosus]|uniref:Uncharacterized protein n=1 Tax=Engystomops pustulosus TaxID=76066 RepID=A0AAV7BLX0_ENGPU|nr:hypothetical protein GDO81_012469 [Engystomops pustulosus]